MRFLTGVVVTLLAVAALVSCARSLPTAPAVHSEEVGASSIAVFTAGSPNRALLGWWTFHIPADRSFVEAVPQRVATLHLNTVRLLEVTPCADCLQIGDFFVTSSGILHVEVTLKHPFPGLDRYTGFDVRAIVISGSDYVFPASGRRIAWGDDHIRLMAADGYTTLYNPTEYPVDNPGPPALRYIPGHMAPGGELTATLNPFVCWMKGEERRMFPAGQAETRTLSLRLPAGDLEFGYAVDACWTPVEEPVTDPLSDFPLTANCREAYAIFPRQGAGLMPVAGSSAPLQVEIWDHQGVGTISTVIVEAPNLFSDELPLNVSTTTEEGILYTGTLTNEFGAADGDYPLLVRVIDWDSDENLGQIDAWQIVPVKVTESGYPLNELVHIPEGWFFMGVDPANDPWGWWFAEPGHMHPTGSYYISRYEVTCREFSSFIAAGGYYSPEWWSEDGWIWRNTYQVTHPYGWNMPLGQGDQIPDNPIRASYWEAEAFCTWAGGRLPNEAELERAGRGDSDHRLWPWGDEWDPTLLAWTGNPLHEAMFHYAPVGTYSPQGDSPWGLADCAGNIHEMTSDWFTKLDDLYEQYASGDFTPPPPPEPGEPQMKATRDAGLSASDERWWRCANRYNTADITTLGPHGGFRLVFDAD